MNSIDLMKQLSDQKHALDQSAIVAKTDAFGTITYVNDMFCEISGYSREELIGKTHKVVNSGTHASEFFQDFWETIQQGKVWRGEICNRKKNGELYWVYTTIVPFVDLEGKPNSYLAIRFDITPLKLAQKTIVDQQSRLIAASRLSAIGEMAAAITHEINNPLGVILGRCEMMRSILSSPDFSTEELLRMVSTIEITANRIEKIVHSMRTLARQGNSSEPGVLVHVEDLLNDSLILCQNRFENHGVGLEIKNECSGDIQIKCRPSEIAQVLVNLLNNAFDAVKDLSEKWVQVEAQTMDKELSIRVTDSGKGIPSNIQEKIFIPFYTTKDVLYGTGLGLSVSRSLMQNNGGSLIYDSSSNNTCFVITLPLAEY